MLLTGQGRGLGQTALSRRQVLIASARAGVGALAWSGRTSRPRRPVKEAAAATGVGTEEAALTLFLCGDVMTGRGIDQILPHPADPVLYEPVIDSARRYVDLAEAANGPIPRPADFSYIWGDALAEMERRRPRFRIVNLETSITKSLEPWPKGINYKMSPANVPCLTAAGIDCCVLANNHVLDWGYSGLTDTLDALARAGIATVGAGRRAAEAERPAVLDAGRRRVLVFGFGSPTSGIPAGWAASPGAAGVNFLRDLSERSADRIAGAIRTVKRPGDVVVASVHWGANWGYTVPEAQVRFAHALIDRAGIDVVHGHSSHHPKAIEVYSGRLVLYGCGDFLNDYEGIGGHEEFRSDLVLAYFPTLGETGALRHLRMAPFRIRNFRLARPSRTEVAWLAQVLRREGERFGTRVAEDGDGTLTLHWK